VAAGFPAADRIDLRSSNKSATSPLETNSRRSISASALSTMASASTIAPVVFWSSVDSAMVAFTAAPFVIV